MDIEVLGPLAVRYGSQSVTPTAAKPRTVLAMLALRPNELVPVDALVEELWGDAIPSSAKTTVQTYVLHLRKLAATALVATPDGTCRDAKQLLVTQPGGYVLNAPIESVDKWHFERLASAGHRARELGDYAGASKRFGEALCWWRGNALLDVQTGPQLRMEAERLEEARLNVLDRRSDADLRLGRHHELLGELRALAAQYPTHEGLCAHLMLALYRSGRRGEARDVYDRLHSRLACVALEPSPPLSRLRESMLRPGGESGTETDRWHAAVTTGIAV
jgi:SARP family transcriptional regulator, regulator of embCAB operon